MVVYQKIRENQFDYIYGTTHLRYFDKPTKTQFCQVKLPWMRKKLRTNLNFISTRGTITVERHHWQTVFKKLISEQLLCAFLKGRWVGSSVTRFGEFSPLLQNFLGIWQKFNPILQFL